MTLCGGGVVYNRLNMDVERTIEHLLELQAQAEIRWQRSEVRWQRAETRMQGVEGRMDRTDKQINGILKLLKMGARAMAGMDDKINALIDAQQRAEGRMDRFERAQERSEARQDRLDARVDRLIRALERGRNGRR